MWFDDEAEDVSGRVVYRQLGRRFHSSPEFSPPECAAHTFTCCHTSRKRQTSQLTLLMHCYPDFGLQGNLPALIWCWIGELTHHLSARTMKWPEINHKNLFWYIPIKHLNQVGCVCVPIWYNRHTSLDDRACASSGKPWIAPVRGKLFQPEF